MTCKEYDIYELNSIIILNNPQRNSRMNENIIST